jgi:hypothetical protein
MIVMLTLCLLACCYLLCSKGFSAFVIYVMDFREKYELLRVFHQKIWAAVKTAVIW